MALSYKLNNLEGVDDAHKGLYKQVDGVFFLDVDGVESAESVTGLKNALQAQKDTVTALKQQEIDATTAATAAEQARLLEAGKHEELAANLTDQLNGLKASNEAARQDKLSSDKKAAAMQMASTVGKDANAIAMLTSLFELDMSYSDAGILQGKAGETLAQMLDRVNKSGMYDSLIKGSQASGGDLHSAGGSGRKKLKDMNDAERIQFKADDPAAFSKELKG
jgi:hypothetical protein